MADLNWNSHNLTHGWQKGVTAFYYGLGFDDADFNRAQIGIGTPLLDGNLCNVHAYELAKQIAQGCKDAGLIGLPFGTPADAFVALRRVEGVPVGNIPCTLKFIVKDIDPAKGEPAEDETGYDDEYNLEELEIAAAAKAA